MSKIQIALRGIFTRKGTRLPSESVLFAKDQFQKLSDRKMKVPVSVIHL